MSAAICAAASNPGSRSARPPSRIAVRPPPRRARDDRLDRLRRWSRRRPRRGIAGRVATLAPGHVRGEDQRRHLAGRPERGGDGLGRVSRPTVCGLVEVRTHDETFRATVSISDCSCASYCAWYVAWSPTMLTTATFARRALWRLASPLPRPGPRCSSVAAGQLGHPRIAVGRPGGDPLEQRQHPAHLRDRVERSHEMHLRGPGIREARGDAGVDECADECLGAVGHVRSVGGCFAEGRSLPVRRLCGRRFRCRR